MDDTVALQVLLNNVDITNHFDLNRSQIEITSAINEELDTLSATVENGDALAIEGWQDIQVKDGSELIFGGYVLTPNRQAGRNLTKNDYPLGASDYGAYLEKVFVQGEFLEMTDAALIQAIFAASSDLSVFDATTYVSVVRTINRAVFNRKSVREVLNWLCEQSGAFWYVDYDKKLHYFGSSEFRAPFDITNDPTSTTKELAEAVQVDVDAAGVVNLVEVLGGNALGGDDTFKFTKVGAAVDLLLNKRLKPCDGASKIAVRRNDGGPTTNLIVNPSFEVNITDGWTQYQAGSGAVWAQDSSKKHAGSYSLKITAGTAVAVMQGQNISLAPGETLTVQARVWCAAAAKAAVVIWDVGNAVNRGECYNRKTSTWEQVTTGYYNDTGTTLTLRCELYNNGCDSSTICYYDAVQAEKLIWPSAYCDGSLGTGYAWSGTANNSTSTRVNVPVWTTMTVKTGNVDTLGARDEVLYFESSGKLQQEAFWPTLSDGIEVDGQEEVPVRVIARNFASYDHYKKWLKYVIVDTSIVDQSVARMRAATYLAENAFDKETIRFDVRKSGLRAGQTINIYLPQRGIDGDYMIRNVSTSIGVGGHLVAQVEVGAADQGLVALLLQLKRKSNATVELAEDESLDHVIDFDEEFTIDETDAVVTRSSAPYLWDAAKWDYAVYASE